MLNDHCETFSITSALILGLVSCHDPCRGLMKQSAYHFFGMAYLIATGKSRNNSLGVFVSVFFHHRCHRFRIPPSSRQKKSSQNKFIVFLKQAFNTHTHTHTSTKPTQPITQPTQPSTTSFSPDPATTLSPALFFPRFSPRLTDGWRCGLTNRTDGPMATMAFRWGVGHPWKWSPWWWF